MIRRDMLWWTMAMISYDWHWRLGMKLKACAINKRFARRTAMAIGMRAKDLCNFFGIRMH